MKPPGVSRQLIHIARLPRPITRVCPYYQTEAPGPVSGAACVRWLCRWEIACTIIGPGFQRRSAVLDSDRRSTTPRHHGRVCLQHPARGKEINAHIVSRATQHKRGIFP